MGSVMGMAIIKGWDNYYVIVGSSAAGLTGLTFVVIALAADARRMSVAGLRAFVTPTILYFCTVLGLSAYLSMPGQNLLSLGVGLGLVGAGGIFYAIISGVSMRRLDGRYVPVIEDWLWHVIFPGIVYAGLLASAVLLQCSPLVSLYAIAVLLLVLLFIGIHNAWDVAAAISLRPVDEAQKPEPQRPAPPADT
ncbi:MAG: hypothetical protein ABSE43_12945 [Steroidobacteraceae bacterium]|jgi:hypothetical protein